MKKILLLIVLCVSSIMSYADTCDLSMGDATVVAGSTVVLPINIDGKCTAFQYQLYTPTGVSVTKVLRGTVLKEQTEEEENLWSYFDKSLQEDGSMMVAGVASDYNTETGEAVKMTLSCDETVAPGEYTLYLKEIVCTVDGKDGNTKKEISSTLTVTSATAINEISTAEDNAPAYNIAGQRVTKSAKGIVVKNGRKVVVK